MTRATESRRDFLKRGTAAMVLLPVRAFPKGEGGTGIAAGAQNAVVGSSHGPTAGPMFENIDGQMGPVTELADGRFLALYAQGRIDVQWDALNIPQLIWGRFSPDGLGGWGERQVMFTFPDGPGAAADGITSGSALPLTTGDGTVHIFGIVYDNWPKDAKAIVSEWFKTRCELWHSASLDDGRTWGSIEKIDYGHSYTGALNSVIQLKSGRILLALSYYSPNRSTGFFVSETIYSDDGAKTWKICKNDVPVESGGKGAESGACEPVLVELEHGRVWMVIRTQTGYLFESFSDDGGESWSRARRTIFHASNAPAGVLRLKDGRVVLVWNNEFGPPFADGISYSRQSLVIAIHDGKSWCGYRELVTFGPDDNEKGWGGARYPFLAETRDGTILVAYSEYGRVSRKKVESTFTSKPDFADYRLVRVDPRWILETSSFEDFSQGLDRLQLAQTTGIEVLSGPESKPALRMRKPRQDGPSGLSWNFPFSRRGRITIRLRTEPVFGGVYLALSESFLAPSNNGGGAFRWMVASDGRIKAQYVSGLAYEDVSVAQFGVTENRKFHLQGRETHELSVEWDCEYNTANIELDGHYTATLVGLEPTRGLGYLHLFSAALATDTNGLWVLSFRSESVAPVG